MCCTWLVARSLAHLREATVQRVVVFAGDYVELEGRWHTHVHVQCGLNRSTYYGSPTRDPLTSPQ